MREHSGIVTVTMDTVTAVHTVLILYAVSCNCSCSVSNFNKLVPISAFEFILLHGLRPTAHSQ